MDILLGDVVNLSQWVVGYNVNMSMWNLVLYGLREIKMDKVRVERNTDLSQVRARIMVQRIYSSRWCAFTLYARECRIVCLTGEALLLSRTEHTQRVSG